MAERTRGTFDPTIGGLMCDLGLLPAHSPHERRVAGRWVTPLIDARFGLPSMSTRTVSVVAPHCIVADALTKVVALRGAASAAVLASYGAEAIMLTPVKGRWRCVEIPADGQGEPRAPRCGARRDGAWRDAARPPG